MPKAVVVEDSLFMRRFVAAILADAGFDVLEAGDGAEGRDKIREAAPDVVVTDLLMPTMTGFDMVSSLRDEGWTGPVVVVSADIQETTREKCLSMGVHAVLNKPPQQAVLLAQVQEAIAAASVR